MHVLPLQEKQVRLRAKVSNLRDKFEGWEGKSKDLIGGFIGLFGRDGRIVSLHMILLRTVMYIRSSL